MRWIVYIPSLVVLACFGGYIYWDYLARVLVPSFKPSSTGPKPRKGRPRPWRSPVGAPSISPSGSSPIDRILPLFTERATRARSYISVYQRTASHTWQVDTATLNDAVTAGVCMSGDASTVASGDPFSQQLAVWRNVAGDGVYHLQTRLTATGWVNGGDNRGIGLNCDMNTDATLLVAGAPSDGTDNWGSVFTFVQTEGTWSQSGAALKGTVSAMADEFGFSVGISSTGTYLIVGSPGFDSNKGCVRFYERITGMWNIQTSLCGAVDYPDALGTPRIGSVVTITPSGDYAAAAGLLDNSNRGAVWVYKQSGGVWISVQKIPSPTSSLSLQSFGASVAMTSAFLVVGQPGFNSESKQTIVFRRLDDGYVLYQVIDKTDAVSCENDESCFRAEY